MADPVAPRLAISDTRPDVSDFGLPDGRKVISDWLSSDIGDRHHSFKSWIARRK
jgi:hypothetical protein